MALHLLETLLNTICMIFGLNDVIQVHLFIEILTLQANLDCLEIKNEKYNYQTKICYIKVWIMDQVPRKV